MKLPSPITILMVVVVIAAITTWLIPAGKYSTLTYNEGFIFSGPAGDTTLPFSQATLDSLGIKVPVEKFSSGSIRKPVSVPGTYRALDRSGQGLVAVIKAPVKGIYESIDVILFILVIGGFMNVFNQTGALVAAMTALSVKLKGRESILIILFTFLFSFGGSSFGMAEEGLAFYAVLVPLFLAAGYDVLLPVAVIFAGTQLGTLSSFSNPFSTIIASNAAGIDWSEGLMQRIIMFLVTTTVAVWYFVRYANKIRRDPTLNIQTGDSVFPAPANRICKNGNLLVTTFLITFVVMVYGVVARGWWLEEMSALFLASSLAMAFIGRTGEKNYISWFVKGCEELLGVALIVGVARGVTLVLNEGNVSDSIVYFAAGMIEGMPPVLFILSLMVLYMVFSLFISSSSGMAVLTMPVMGSLAYFADVPGREIVNAYLYGMGIMGFISPTGLILPSLAIVKAGFGAWIRFILPLMIILFVICAVSLAIGIYYK